MSASNAETIHVDGREVIVTNPGKILFAQAGHTKLDVVRYYLSVADGALRGSGDRPNVLVRYPDGIDGEFFFQKRAPKDRPPWVDTVTIANPTCEENVIYGFGKPVGRLASSALYVVSGIVTPVMGSEVYCQVERSSDSSALAAM